MLVGSTRVITTSTYMSSSRGYLAPEYFDLDTGPHTDVYSYGVVSKGSTIMCVFRHRMYTPNRSA